MKPLLFFFVFSMVIGCSHSPVVYPDPKPMYYFAEYMVTRRAANSELPVKSDILVQDIDQSLKSGKRVALLPPDNCGNHKVVPQGARNQETAIQMDCGVLMASIETELARVGYQVISWQAIKGSSSGDAYDRAKNLKIDVLFEVNQLSIEDRKSGKREITKIAFFRRYEKRIDKIAAQRQFSDDDPNPKNEREEEIDLANPKTMNKPVYTTIYEPIEVDQEVGERCENEINKNSEHGHEYTSTVNIKAIEVTTGRALWLFQHSSVETDSPQTEDTENSLFYLAEGKLPTPPEVNDDLSFFGWLGILTPGIVVPLGFVLSLDSENTMETFIPFGVAGVISSIVFFILDYAVRAPDRTIPAPVYPESREVLCMGSSVPNPSETVQDRTVLAKPVKSHTYQFRKTEYLDRDETSERAQRLTKLATDSFIGNLLKITKR